MTLSERVEAHFTRERVLRLVVIASVSGIVAFIAAYVWYFGA